MKPHPQFFRVALVAALLSAGGLTMSAQVTIPIDPNEPEPIPPGAAITPTPPPGTAPMQIPMPGAPQQGFVPPTFDPNEDIRDIRDPVHIPNPWLPYIIAVSVIVGLILLYFLTRWIIRKIQERPEAPPISPYDQALEELVATRSLIADGQDKAFSIAVSDVVRYFLERQFEMPAPECTTEEFLYQIQDHDLIKGQLADEFSRFLQQCDLAKFARQTHGLRGMEEIYGQAEKLVEETYLKHKMQVRILGDGQKPSDAPEVKAHEEKREEAIVS